MKWREIPTGARRYILYHVMVSPMLITWYMLSLYMLMTGYSILEVGAVFTIVRIASIPATYAIGRVFDKLSLRLGLSLIELLEGVANILYSLAYGALAPLMLFLGILVEKIAAMFYPLYQAVEKLLYPEERLEEVFAWHMRLPEISELAGFLALGYVFGHVFNKPWHYRLGFLLFGAASFAMAFYVARLIPGIDEVRQVAAEKLEFRIDREFRYILLVEALTTLAWSLAPDIVLLYYVVKVLGLTLFEVMVVEAAISVGAILATYVTDKIGKDYGFKAMAVGYALISLWAAIMVLSPPFPIVVASYLVSRFGDVLAFPFYRSWIFSKVPREKASSMLAALASYRRLVSLASPFIAGLLASIKPTLPYLASLVLFLLTSLVFLVYSRKR